MDVRKVPLFGVLLVLVLAVLACSFNIGGPAYPDQRIPVSTEAFGDLQSSIQTAVASGETSGQVSLVINESQLTSYLAEWLKSQAQPLFTDPQVYLQDGRIRIFGTAHQGYLEATIELDVSTSVDDRGQLKIELTTADFGPLPVPAGLKDTLTATLQEAFTGAIGPAAVGFRLESITVENGTATLTGRTK
jgi:hypothetical protein